MAEQNLSDGQIVLPRFSEVVQAGSYQGVGEEDRITLGRLIRLAGEPLDFTFEPSIEDFDHSAIPAIERGLYIPYYDTRYQSAKQIIRLGVRPDMPANGGNVGVVFPADEYHIVARNARDLATHTEARTRRANESNDDRDEVRQKAGRSAAHVLAGKIAGMARFKAELLSDQKMLRGLYRDLGSSWIGHYKVKNLERHRVATDEKIHEAAEVSSINWNFGTGAVKGLHKAIKRNLYGGNKTHAEIARTWRDYITMVGLYAGAKILKVELSQNMSETELEKYEPFLIAQNEQQAA